jgi:hypothetical protein
LVLSTPVDGDFAKYFVGLESSEPIHPFSSNEPNTS